MRRTVQFYLNGTLETLDAPPATSTLLDFLRYEKAKTGTKEGCAEGDCGACTVVLGELIDETVTYRAVNSCILFLPTLDGKAVITVEGLDQQDGSLHPVQQAMVDMNGAQCGFCTPGFVMSLYAHYVNERPTETPDLNSALAGNLCRCTGYGPILDAGKAMAGYAPPNSPGTLADAAAKLKVLAQDDMLGYEALSATGAQERFLAPRSLDEMASTLADNPGAVILAGATDVGLWVTKQHKALAKIIYVGQIRDLTKIERTESELIIGAGARYTDALPHLTELWPAFGALLDRLGAVQVRNAGTLGGNIANGSPIGDSMPVLIALGGSIVLRRTGGERRLRLEDFFQGYQKQDRAPDEFVERIHIPLPSPDQYFCCYKVSKRFDQDISAVCAGISITRRQGRVESARIAFGGMAAIPKRAVACEAALTGKPWTLETIRAAAATLKDDFQPLTDLRASSDYRLGVAQNLLIKAYLEDGAGLFGRAAQGAL